MGLEPTTSCSQSRRATKLRHNPCDAVTLTATAPRHEAVSCHTTTLSCDMTRPPIPADIASRLNSVEDLSQWERSQLGIALRLHGWTYAEIAQVTEAAKSTVAHWCREIELDEAVKKEIGARTGSQRGVPRNTQWRRRLERQDIQLRAAQEVSPLMGDSDWIAGTVLYWAEGFKTENGLGMSNSDPHLLRSFITWTDRYLMSCPLLRLKLNLHAGNDEATAIEFWARELSVTPTQFGKTYIKPDGTGHRRNHLEHGVAQVRIRQSTDAFLRVSGWIEGLQRNWSLSQTHD